MIEDTLAKLEARLRHADNLSHGTRAELEKLVRELREEIATVDDPDRAESIAGFTESGTREALRNETDPDLLDLALKGMRTSTREFEASHPRLTAVVNNICQQLSNLGI